MISASFQCRHLLCQYSTAEAIYDIMKNNYPGDKFVVSIDVPDAIWPVVDKFLAVDNLSFVKDLTQ